jgi:hypothetical protein
MCPRDKSKIPMQKHSEDQYIWICVLGEALCLVHILVHYLSKLVTSLSLWKPGLVHVGFMVDREVLGQGFLLRFFLVSIIPLGLHTHISYGDEQ